MVPKELCGVQIRSQCKQKFKFSLSTVDRTKLKDKLKLKVTLQREKRGWLQDSLTIDRFTKRHRLAHNGGFPAS